MTQTIIGQPRARCIAVARLVLLGAALQMTAVAGARAAEASPPASNAHNESATVEATYGISVEGLRLSAAGSMLDFRYRVVDAKKAAPILDGRVQPVLIDDARSAKLAVPNTPVLGRIRQTARNGKIYTDRSYFIIFGNPGKAVHSGDKVTLLMGQVKIADITVQ
jgi:hypothetical protein